MNFLKGLIFFVFVIFILFLFIWALYLPKSDITANLGKTLEEQRARLDLYFQGVTFQESEGGRKYWEIKAKTSSLNKTTGIATLTETRGTFFRSGKPVLKFISPYVTWDMVKKEIFLKEPIGYDLKAERKVRALIKETKNVSSFILPARALKKGEGYFFRAKNLNWELKTEKIICSNGIYLKKGEISGFADKLEADVALEKVNISGNPCTMNITNQSLATLEARNFTVDSLKDELSASGGIKLLANSLKLLSRDLIYKQKDDTIYFKSDVQVVYHDAQAFSDVASYNIKTREITLGNNARLLRRGSQLTGDKVIISLNDGTFKVVGKTKIVIPEEEIK